MNPLLGDYAALSNIHPALLVIVLAWSLIWKGLALWKSAQHKSKVWFIVLLLVNTVGILEILYIYLFSKMDMKSKEMKIKESPKNSKKKSASRKR